MVHGTEITGCAIPEGSDFLRGFVYLLIEICYASINCFLGMDDPIGKRFLKLDDQQSKKHSTKRRDQRIAKCSEHGVSGKFGSRPDYEGRDQGKECPEKTHIIEGVCKLEGVLLSERRTIGCIGKEQPNQTQHGRGSGKLRHR